MLTLTVCGVEGSLTSNEDDTIRTMALDMINSGHLVRINGIVVWSVTIAGTGKTHLEWLTGSHKGQRV